MEARLFYSLYPLVNVSPYIIPSSINYEMIDNVMVIRLNEFKILSTIVDDIQNYNDEIKKNHHLYCCSRADIITRNPVLIKVSFGCDEEIFGTTI